jgi:hypothetical protein
MKKATNPLALDLRAGGFEVFPLAKLFDLPSNVWYPSILIRENMLAEPLAAWASQRFLRTWLCAGASVERCRLFLCTHR